MRGRCSLVHQAPARVRAAQWRGTPNQSCPARVVGGAKAGSLKAEDHSTLISKRHTLALASHQRSTPNQLCPARKPVLWQVRSNCTLENELPTWAVALLGTVSRGQVLSWGQFASQPAHAPDPRLRRS